MPSMSTDHTTELLAKEVTALAIKSEEEQIHTNTNDLNSQFESLIKAIKEITDR